MQAPVTAARAPRAMFLSAAHLGKRGLGVKAPQRQAAHKLAKLLAKWTTLPSHCTHASNRIFLGKP